MVAHQTSKAGEIALFAATEGFSVGVAESLTGGSLATELAKAPDASDWFVGGVVAYQRSVKETLLGVTARHQVSAQCAAQMAAGAHTLLGADLTLAATGVGGPDPADEQPAGTVFIAAQYGEHLLVDELHISGAPEVVIASTVALAVDLALEAIRAEVAASEVEPHPA